MTTDAGLSDDAVNEMAKAVLPRALAVARQWAWGRDDLAEKLIDAATDGVLRAIKLYRPEQGEFPTFAMRVVEKRLAIARRNYMGQVANRPAMASLSVDDDSAIDPPAADKPIGGRTPMSPELKDLPQELWLAVFLVYFCGYTLEDAGLLSGCLSAPSISKRLREAAVILAADGAEQPVRRPREKRVRGGKGH